MYTIGDFPVGRVISELACGVVPVSAAATCGNAVSVMEKIKAARASVIFFFMRISPFLSGASSRSRPVMKGVCPTFAPDSMSRR